MTELSQSAVFNRFRDQLRGVTEAKDPGPENPKKDSECQLSKYGQKAAKNVSPSHNKLW